MTKKQFAKVEIIIHKIRGQEVMLDEDLAYLYDIQTKKFNQAVQRNHKRFPSDFMFQLSQEEYNFLRSQFVTSKKGRGGRRYLPYVFTEQGIAMLSSILTSTRAIEVNIVIMRSFVRLRGQRVNGETELSLFKKITNELFEDIFNRLERIEENGHLNYSRKIGFFNKIS